MYTCCPFTAQFRDPQTFLNPRYSDAETPLMLRIHHVAKACGKAGLGSLVTATGHFWPSLLFP